MGGLLQHGKGPLPIEWFASQEIGKKRFSFIERTNKARKDSVGKWDESVARSDSSAENSLSRGQSIFRRACKEAVVCWPKFRDLGVGEKLIRV